MRKFCEPLGATLLFLAALASTAMAQTSYSGTVDMVGHDVLVVSRDPFDLPMRYSASARLTTYLDENGNPIPADRVKQGSPVTVYYDANGDTLTAARVVVRTHP